MQLLTSVVWNKKADVGVIENSGDTDQACAATRNDGNIFPGVLRGLSLAVHLVVETSNSLSQRFYTRSRAILATIQADIDGLGTGEATLNFVFDLRGTLCSSL